VSSWNKYGAGPFVYAAKSEVFVAEMLPEGEHDWSPLLGVKL
jgi:hypothetical protein